jgi:hypothetical protein
MSRRNSKGSEIFLGLDDPDPKQPRPDPVGPDASCQRGSRERSTTWRTRACRRQERGLGVRVSPLLVVATNCNPSGSFADTTSPGSRKFPRLWIFVSRLCSVATARSTGGLRNAGVHRLQFASRSCDCIGQLSRLFRRGLFERNARWVIADRRDPKPSQREGISVVLPQRDRQRRLRFQCQRLGRNRTSPHGRPSAAD